jgi:hypothetical protein
MSTQNETAATTAAPTNHTDAAQALIEKIRAMREEIPNFVFPTSKAERQRLARAASVPPEFIELTAVAVTNSKPLVRGGDADPAQTRNQLSMGDAFLPVADEAEALATFIRHSATAAKNKAGFEALTTYELAKRLAKRPETADLAPHVEDMKRALNRGRKTKAKAAPTPTPGPTQPPVTPSPTTTPSTTTPAQPAPVTPSTTTGSKTS